MKKYIANIIMILCVMYGTGCATASRGFKPSPTQITSAPTGATIKIDGKPVGITPMIIRLSPKKDIIIEAELQGHAPAALVSMSGVDTGGRVAMVANASGIIFPPALLVTYGVDYFTGAYKIHPPLIHIPLTRSQ